MLNNHHLTQDYVKKYDEPILKHLEDISSKLHDEGHGFTLTFVFNDAVSEYFTPSTLIKTYHMIDENVLEWSESTEITWADGMNPTKEKVKWKQKHKWTGEVREIVKEVDRDSFFTFFKGHDMPPPEEMASMDEDAR